MNDDLLRQRRNLLLISSILILIQLAGIKIEKLSILGTVLKVERIEVIVIAMWVVWFYLFLRYYQYLRSTKDLKIYKEYRSKVKRSVDLYLIGVAGHKGYRPDYEFREKSFFTWWYVKNRSELPEAVTPFYWVIWSKLIATIHVTINTPLVTDHLLPVIIGLTPLVILVV